MLYAITLGDPAVPIRHLVSIDVASGRERTRRPLPASMRPGTPLNPAIRMSLNADETKFPTSVVRLRSDVWILER
jgi:hypothetical protein